MTCWRSSGHVTCHRTTGLNIGVGGIRRVLGSRSPGPFGLGLLTLLPNILCSPHLWATILHTVLTHTCGQHSPLTSQTFWLCTIHSRYELIYAYTVRLAVLVLVSLVHPISHHNKAGRLKSLYAKSLPADRISCGYPGVPKRRSQWH